MKKNIYAFLLVSISAAVIAGICYGQAETPAAAEKSAEQPAAKKAVEPATLSEEAIANLLTEYKDPQTGKEWKFISEMSVPRLNAAQKAAALQSKKTPYRVTAALYQIQEVQGRRRLVRESGDCNMVVTDPEGKVIHTSVQSLNKMCPS